MPTRHKSTTAKTPVRSTATVLPPPLSPHWAFVVQLQTSTSLNAAQLHGRIEHLVSGQATTFHSLDELHSFMEQILSRKEEEKPP